MPIRVPITPQVQENVRPGVRMDMAAPAGAFGGGPGVANNIGQANEALEIEKQELQKIDFYDAMNAVTQLKMWENQSGYESVLGENARELPKKMQGEYRKRASELSAGLKSDRVRTIFQRKADENEVGFMGAVENHALRQKSISEAQRTDAFVQTWQDAGIKAGAAGNAAELDKAANEISTARTMWGMSNGMPDVAVERMIADDTSKVYHGAIIGMLRSGNDLQAKNAFDQYKDKLSAKDQQHLAGLVEDGSYRGQAQRELARIMAGSMQPGEVGPPAPPTEKQTYAEVDKIKDPKLQDMVRDRLRERWGDIKRVEDDALKADAKEAADIIEQTPSLDAIPVDLFQRLSRTTRSGLQARADQIRRGEAPVAASDKYLELRRQAAVEPMAFAKLNPVEWRGKITDAEVKELVKEQGDILKGDANAAKRRQGFLTVEEMGKQRLALLGVDDPAQVAKFTNLLNLSLYNWRNNPQNEGKEPDPAEASAMVSRLLGNRRRWYQFSGEGTAPVLKFESNVPDADRKAITEKLIEAGRAVNDDAILEIYLQGKR